MRLREEAWRQAIKDGRWTDISKQEMEDNAEQLYLDVETMVLRRDVVGLFRDGVTVLVDGLGAAAEAILSVRLWSHIDRLPTVVPIVRVPLPVKQPAVPPKPPPPVNAPSLGSDTRATFSGSVHTTPRPAAPGKTPSGSRNVSPN